jgi:hypothetical protein
VGAGGSVDRRDSYIQFTFTAPGKYIIGVGEFDSFNNNGQIAGNPPDLGDIYTLQVSLAGKPFTPATPDLYSFNLDAGESATVAVTALSTGNLSVQLQNSAGTTVATGSGGSINVAEVISNFVAPAAGTYFAVVGSGGVDYSLLVTRNADFDTEDNNDLASAREVLSTPVAGRQWVLGSLGTGPSLTVDAADSGWWDSTGSHDASNDNFIVGTLGTQYRDFFVFDLSAVSLPIVGAQLRLFQQSGAYGSLDPTETYTVFDVTTPIPDLGASGSGQTAIFDDLGTGASFGSTTVSAADNGGFVSVTLNAAALASLNASSGGLAAVGGALTSLGGSAGQFDFGGSGAHNLRQLVLTLLDPADFYQVTLTAGQSLEVETSTPGGGAGTFENPLDPTIRVYDSGGNLVASDDNSASDGRNARLTYPVPSGAGGIYYVAVAASSATTERTAGEYILSINVNNAPTIAVPAAQTAYEDVDRAISGLSVGDPDGEVQDCWVAKEKVRDIYLELKDQRQAAVQRLRFAQRALGEAIESPTPNESLIAQRSREVADAQANTIRLRSLTEARILQVLTPEQRTRLREMRQRNMALRRERQKGSQNGLNQQQQGLQLTPAQRRALRRPPKP